MAKGRVIDNNKVKVTGFTENELSEKTYRVNVSGTSVAELSAGKTLTSNIAIVRHEKYADITLSDPVTGDTSCCGYTYSITITSRNIVDGTLRVVTYPSWVSKFAITGNKLCYNLYQNYEVDPNYDIGVFVVAGEDEYGNLITSEQLSIRPGDKYDWGAIMWEESGITVSASETSGTAIYNLSGCVLSSSIEICGYYGNIYGIELVTGDTSGQISIYFPENRSRNFEKNYAVRLCGVDEFGVSITSDILIITQEKAAESPSFYLTGENIDYLDTEGVFSVIYDPDEISGGTIGIYDWSRDTITGTPEYDHEASKVTVETLENTGASEKVLLVTMSAITVYGIIIYASGLITQAAGKELKIYNDLDNPETEVTSSTRSAYFEQRRSFRYTSKNVGVITPIIENRQEEGTAVYIDTVNKSVTVIFPRNETSEQKTFKIKLLSEAGLEATYQFYQNAFIESDFRLSGGTNVTESVPNEGYIEHTATTFTLKIVYNPEKEYSNFGISLNSSDSPIYKITSAVVNEDEMIVSCETYENTDQREHIYQIQVSATTKEGVEIDTRIYTLHHKKEVIYNAKISAITTAVTVDATATTFTGASFAYTAITYAFIDDIITSDGTPADGEITVFNGNVPTGIGKYDITFEQNPDYENRTIEVHIGGQDKMYGEYFSDTHLIITQRAAIRPKIELNKNPIELKSSYAMQKFDYEVYTTGITESTLGVIYNENIFSGITVPNATEAIILVENMAMGVPAVYSITFTGQSITSNEIIREDLKIIQPSPTCETTALTISSEAAYYDGEKYIIDVNGGYYKIYIDKIININPYSLKLVAHNEYCPDIASGTSDGVTFKPAPGNPKEWETGSVDGDVINVPVGNDSVRYYANNVTMRKGFGQEETENLFIYYIDLDRYEVEEETEVWLTGTTYCGGQISSNTLTFLQKGTPTKPEA